MVKESKLLCKAVFGIDGQPETRSNTFDGVLHLFEHEYDPETTFWYGAAEIACNFQDFVAAQTKGRLTEFHISFSLEDGRGGAARNLNYRFDELAKFTFVGFTKLAKPPARAASQS
jgi:hypothetical protein